MRSTRATAAVARLNARSEDRQYVMVLSGNGLFILRERIAGDDRPLSEPLSLDDFVRLLDSMGPKKIPRVTNYEAAFMRQLVKRNPAA